MISNEIISTNNIFIHYQEKNNINKVSGFGAWPANDHWLIIADLNGLSNLKEKSSKIEGNSSRYANFNIIVQSKTLLTWVILLITLHGIIKGSLGMQLLYS